MVVNINSIEFFNLVHSEDARMKFTDKNYDKIILLYYLIRDTECDISMILVDDTIFFTIRMKTDEQAERFVQLYNNIDFTLYNTNYTVLTHTCDLSSVVQVSVVERV